VSCLAHRSVELQTSTVRLGRRPFGVGILVIGADVCAMYGAVSGRRLSVTLFVVRTVTSR
jgi:hypothetical protein